MRDGTRCVHYTAVGRSRLVIGRILETPKHYLFLRFEMFSFIGTIDRDLATI